MIGSLKGDTKQKKQMLNAIFGEGKLKKSFGNGKSKKQMKVNVQMNVFAKSK